MSNANGDRVQEMVMQMVFRNEQFQEGVSETLQSLKELSQTTSETVKTINSSVIEGLGNAVSKVDIQGFSKALNGIDLSGIVSGIDALNNKFNFFGTATRTIIQDITREVEHMAKSFMNIATSGPQEGWRRYDMYSNVVKTLVNSAKDADGAAVSLSTVNKVLADLNEYADQTIYSFADMTNNITKFTNAGVDLESASKAMKGIANLAAVSGANANEAARAMYNFGQALGSGFVRYIDWKSILNANMATLDFKQTLIDTAYELGTLRKEGDRYVSTLDSESKKQKAVFNASREFDESLKDKWMTTEVLTAALAKYTDTETEFGRKAIIAAKQVNTFAKMLDVIKDALGSEWMKSYQHIFGNYEEQTKLWTGMYEAIEGAISKVSDFRNKILETWKTAGGRNALIDAFSNIWKILSAIAEPVSKLLDLTNGPAKQIGEKLAGWSEKFKDSTAGLLELFGFVEEKGTEVAETVETVTETVEDLTEMAKLVIRGDYGNGRARREALEAEGRSYERIQNKVNELLGCSFRYEVQEEETTEAIKEETKETEKQAKAMSAFSDYMHKVGRNLQQFAWLFDSVRKLVGQAGGAIFEYIVKPFAREVPNAFLKVTSIFATAIKFVRRILIHIRQAEWIPKVVKAWATSFGLVKDAIIKLVTPFANFIKDLLKIDALKNFGESVLSFADKFINFWTSIPGAIRNTVDSVSEALSKLSGFQALGERLSKVGSFIKDGLIGAFERVFEFLSNVFKNNILGDFFTWFTDIFNQDIKEGSFFEKVFSEDGILNQGALAIDHFLGVIGGAAHTIGEFIKNIFKPKTDLDHSSLGIMASGFKLLENIKIPDSIKNFLEMSWADKLHVILNGIVDIFGFVINLLGEFINIVPQTPTFENIVKQLKAFGEVLKGGFFDVVGKAREVIGEFLDSHVYSNPKFENIFGPNGLVPNSIAFIKEWIEKIKNFPQTLKEMNLFGKAMEKITGSDIYKKGQEIVQFFKNLFYTVTHLGDTEPVQNFFNTVTTFLEQMRQKGLNVIEKIKGYIEKAKELPETIKNLKLFDKIMERLSKNPLFQRVQNGGQKVIGFVKNLYHRVRDFVKSDAVQKFGETLIGIFVALGEGIVAVSGKILDFIGWVAKIPEKLNQYGILEKIGSAFQTIYSVGKKVTDFLIKLFDKLSHIGELEGVQKLLTTLTEFFTFVKDTAIGVLKELLEYLDKTFGTDLISDDGFINFFGEGGVVDTASKVLSSFLQQIEKAPEIFKKFGNFFTGTGEGTLYSGITSKFPVLQKFFGKASNFFTGIGSAIDSAIPDLGMSGIAASGKTSALGAFAGILTEGYKFPKLSDIIKKATGDIAGSFDEMGSSATTVATNTQGAVITGEDIIEMAKQMYPVIQEHVLPVLKTWAERAAELGANDWLQIFGKLAIVRTLFKFGDGVKNIAKGLGFWSDGMKEAKGGFEAFKKMMEAFEKTPGKLNGMLDAFAKVPDTVKKFTETITDVKKLKPILKEWRKKSLTTALRDFAIAVALVAGSIWLLGSDFIDYDKIKENRGVLLAFAAVIAAFWWSASVMSPEQLTAIGVSFAGMGAGLLLLTGALYIFGKMDFGQMIQGAVAVGLLMIAMGKAAEIATGYGKMAVFGFIAMALAINILVPAVKALGSMDLRQLIQGGIAVVAFMGFMATAALIAGFAGKQAVFSFLAIALAIDLLVPAVFLLGKMPTETLVKGGAAVVVFMTFMALAVRIASKNSVLASVSFVGMVLAVGLLIPMMLAISFIPAERVIGGGAAIVALMLSLAWAVKIATSGTNKEAIAAMLAMAGVVALVGIIMVELARYNLSNVLGVAVSLGLVFLSLGFAFKQVADINPEKQLGAFIALSSVLIVASACLGVLASLPNAKYLLPTAVSLSLVLLALSAALRIANGIKMEAAVEAAKAIDAFGLIVGALMGVIGGIDMLTKGRLQEAFNHFGLMLNALWEGLHGNKIGEAKTVKEDAQELEEASGSLTSFAEKIGGFIEMLTGVDEGKAAAAKNLGDAILAITKAEILSGLGNLLKLKGDFATFGETLEAYVTSLFSFIDIVNANDSVADNEKLDAVEEATTRWMNIAKQLEPNVGWIPTIAGMSSIEEFGNQMRGFIIGFEAFNRIVVNIRQLAPSEKYERIAAATEKMMDMAKHLDANKGFIPWLVGYTDIGKFGENLGTFITGFKVFNSELLGVETIVSAEKVGEVKAAVSPMVELSKILKREEGVLGWIFGNVQELSSFGTNLGKFAEGVVSFNNTLIEGNVNSALIYRIAESMKLIGELSTTNTHGLNSFAGCVGQLAKHITALTGEGGITKADNIDTMVTALYRIRGFAISLASINLEQLNGFTESIKNLAKLSVDGFVLEFTTNRETAYDAVSGFLEYVAGALNVEGEANLFIFYGNKLATDFITAYDETKATAESTVRLYMEALIAILNRYPIKFQVNAVLSAAAYIRGLDSKKKDTETKAGELAKAAYDVLGSQAVKDEFESAGKNAVQGFINGLANSELMAKVREKASALADTAKQAAMDTLGEESPSKEFRKIGEYATIGMALGIEDKASEVEKASQNMANGSLMTAMAGVHDLARMISEDLDAEPTIRPVVDTSGVRYGIGLANGMLDTFANSPAVQAALEISSIQNADAMQVQMKQQMDYTAELKSLVANTKMIIDAARQNRNVSIDGDYLYGYVNTRMGMA